MVFVRVRKRKAGTTLGWKTSKFKLMRLDEEIENCYEWSDWSGFYVAETRDTALGYATDYLDSKGSGVVYLHKINLKKDVEIVFCGDESFQDGSYLEKNTENKIKEELLAYCRIRIEPSMPLVPSLGRAHLMLAVYHDDEKDVEIIVPHQIKADYIETIAIKKYTYRSWEIFSEEAITNPNPRDQFG